MAHVHESSSRLSGYLSLASSEGLQETVQRLESLVRRSLTWTERQQVPHRLLAARLDLKMGMGDTCIESTDLGQRLEPCVHNIATLLHSNVARVLLHNEIQRHESSNKYSSM